MSFLVESDCTYLGKSTYPRANQQVGTQLHFLSGVESAKVACDSTLFETKIPEGSKVHVKFDFLATKKGNFLKALSMEPLATIPAK